MEGRGDDSWGYVSDGRIYKGLGGITQSVQARSFRNSMTLMAHTRAASVGKVSLPNAHPFHIGKVILSHNGGISNWRDLNKDHNRDFEVDSMHLAAHLAEGKDFGDLRGWGTIEFQYEGKPDEVFLCKLNGGSLEMAQMFIGGEQFGVAWASTAGALYYALGVAGIQYKMLKVDEEHLFRVKDGDVAYFMDKDNRKVKVALGKGWAKSHSFPHRHEDPKEVAGPSPHKAEKSRSLINWTEMGEKMRKLQVENPAIFVGLVSKDIQGGWTIYTDKDGHVYSMLSRCYWCGEKDKSEKPTTYFGGFLNERLCSRCVVDSRVDEWYSDNTQFTEAMNEGKGYTPTA